MQKSADSTTERKSEVETFTFHALKHTVVQETDDESRDSVDSSQYYTEDDDALERSPQQQEA